MWTPTFATVASHLDILKIFGVSDDTGIIPISGLTCLVVRNQARYRGYAIHYLLAHGTRRTSCARALQPCYKEARPGAYAGSVGAVLQPATIRFELTTLSSLGITQHLIKSGIARLEEIRSADGTLAWEWRVAKNGARHFETKLWNGRRYVTVLNQNVAAPPSR